MVFFGAHMVAKASASPYGSFAFNDEITQARYHDIGQIELVDSVIRIVSTESLNFDRHGRFESGHLGFDLAVKVENQIITSWLADYGGYSLNFPLGLSSVNIIFPFHFFL